MHLTDMDPQPSLHILSNCLFSFAQIQQPILRLMSCLKYFIWLDFIRAYISFNKHVVSALLEELSEHYVVEKSCLVNVTPPRPFNLSHLLSVANATQDTCCCCLDPSLEPKDPAQPV